MLSQQQICLFCGTPGHIMKDCPKAASSKAQAAKTDQENTTSSSSDPKKTKQSPRLRTTQVLL